MEDEIKEYVIKFHNTYEKLAINYGYETRNDTKELDFNSSNGKLMYATVDEIISPLLDYITNLQNGFKSTVEELCETTEKLEELQQENERLKEELEDRDITIYSHKVGEVRYRKRINNEELKNKKALQIIKECKMLMPHEFDWEEQINNIQNILQGSDKDE